METPIKLKVYNELTNSYEYIYPINKITLWNNNNGVLINQSSREDVTLNNMPDLTDYIGEDWLIHLFIGYGSDAIQIETFSLKKSGSNFIRYIRNYAGANDVLFFVFSLTGLNSTNWKFINMVQKALTNSESILTTSYGNIRLYKVMIEKI